MTTREVTLFLQELGEVRQELGGALERLKAFEPRFREIADHCDRLNEIERSLELCQSACGRERKARAGVLHYVLYLVAASVPGTVLWYLQAHPLH